MAFDTYVPVIGPSYSQWVVKCPHHDACVLRRTTSARNCTHGHLEPLAYLYVRRDVPVPAESAHVRQKMPQDKVLECLEDAEVRRDLQAIYDQLAS